MATKPEKSAAPAAPPAAAPAIEAPKAAAPAAAIVPRKAAPLIVSRWSESQFKQARHAITPEAGTRLIEDLTDPAYYAHIASKVNAGDVIEARPSDGAFYAELYVWAKGATWLQVSLLKHLVRPGPSAVPAATKGFSIEFVEGAAKHRIVRDSDRAELARGFDSPDAANTWLEANKIRIAA